MFNAWFQIILSHDEARPIRKGGAQKLRDFAKKMGMKVIIGDYSRPGNAQPPDLIIEFLGNSEQVKEGKELLKTLGCDIKVPDVVPLCEEVVVKPKRPMIRLSFARRGERTTILSNYLEVDIGSTNYLYHYSVSVFYEDECPVEDKCIEKKCIFKFHETYLAELAAYDCQKSVFTATALPSNKREFIVVLDDISSIGVDANGSPGHDGSPSKHPCEKSQGQYHSNTFKVQINPAAKIPLRAIARGLWGNGPENSEDALQVLNMILRQGAATQRWDHDNFGVHKYFGGGVQERSRTYSRFIATQGGLLLNMDVPLQPYTKAMSILRRSNLVQKPYERTEDLSHALGVKIFGFSIAPSFTKIKARVLSAPKIICGDGEEISPQNGRWNFNKKKIAQPTVVANWAIVNFSTHYCDIPQLWKDLVRCGQQKGMEIAEPLMVIQETYENSYRSPVDRVKSMFKIIKDKLPAVPSFILCLLPERKTSVIYGPWKKITLVDRGVVTQCIAPRPGRVNDQYLTNVLLKINAKLGGLNSLLAMDKSPPMTLISKEPTMILGMHVSRGSDGPSVAAVVGSKQWPSISCYGASVRRQSPNVMIDLLFKKVSDTCDEGMICERLLDFYKSSGHRKPVRIVIFRDGVTESQFDQVLNVELEQIIQACKSHDANWHPTFTLIAVQRNHHTKFLQHEESCGKNVPPGTVLDNMVSHPRNNDFYMCAHNGGPIGISRPTHYHVLLNTSEFSSTDDLQELVYSLSYASQTSTSASAVVAPIHYARLAASQVAKITNSSLGLRGVKSPGALQLPSLHTKVSSSMFFC